MLIALAFLRCIVHLCDWAIGYWDLDSCLGVEGVLEPLRWGVSAIWICCHPDSFLSLGLVTDCCGLR